MKIKLILIASLLVHMVALGQDPLIGSEPTVEEICLRSQDSCRECIIANPECTWCADNRTAVGTRRIRCRIASENINFCNSGFLENPQSSVTPTTDEPFSIINDSATDIANLTVIQLKPQALNVKLRKGQPHKVNLTFRRVVDYPLDLYYVMDLSYSMRDDLDILKSLGSSLVEDIRNITNNVRLGFGTFVDKVMLPFASTVPQELQDPCTNIAEATCAPVFGFRHQLSITADGDAFRDAVQATNISGNIDSPEGGFDALMQIAVCQNEIKWRQEALRVILFTSDASPHIAMDGKLAAILELNDMQCHLEKGVHAYLPEAIVYSRSKTMDYPSIGQLKKAFEINRIQTILAVTTEVLPYYRDLPNILENSFVNALNNDSSNVVSVISTSYEALRTKIQLSTPIVPSNVDMKYRVLCPDTSEWVENSLYCANATIGSEVIFQFELTALSCPSQDGQVDVVSIDSSSIRDTVEMSIEYICQCDCLQSQVENSSLCSSNGDLECGICSCDPGILGLKCQCTQSSTDIPLEQNCTKEFYVPDRSTLCNGHGYCECGFCECEGDHYGKYCECTTSGCPEGGVGSEDSQPCGGPERGRCENCNNVAQCICESDAGWYKNPEGVCICNDDMCINNETELICDEHGECNCGECDCDSNYKGNHCAECIHPDCKPYAGTCSGTKIHTCAVCVYTQEMLRKDTTEECASVCKDVGITFRPISPLPNCATCNIGIPPERCDACPSTDASIHAPQTCTTVPFSNCELKYEIVWDTSRADFLLFVQNFARETDCPETDPITIILPVVGGIVLIGIISLVIWKIITTLRDKREYQNFIDETRKTKWAESKSPIYVNPNNRIQNPAYIGKL